MFNIYNYLDVLLVAVFTTLGAFVPIFVLMVSHYFVRKSDYMSRKKMFETFIEMDRAMVKINDEAINTVYKSLKVKDYPSLVNKLKDDKKFGISKYFEITEFVKNNISQKLENQEKVNNLLLEKGYLENYNFKTYISNLLDRHFPDKRGK